ncbi:hypothetical protein OC704_02165 [Sweet potato little leaf phytoplasma]
MWNNPVNRLTKKRGNNSYRAKEESNLLIMESGVLGNLLAPFGRGLLVIFDKKQILSKKRR